MTTLPALRGRDLTGRPRTLPEDLRGAPAVLLLGFAIRHQSTLDQWLGALAGCEAPLVEVPVAQPRDERFAAVIEGGMVPGVPRDRHGHTVVVYTDVQRLVTALGLPGPVPAAVLLDAGGGVRSVHPGAPTEPAVADVRTGLAAQQADAERVR